MNNTDDMHQHTVSWQESWRPAFERLLASIATVDRLTRTRPSERRSTVTT